MKILRIQKSKRPITDTCLSINGVVNDFLIISPDEQSYEMVINFYKDSITPIPVTCINVHPNHHQNNISKYGMAALLKGIEMTSVLDIAEKAPNDCNDYYQKEVEAIAYMIVGKMEQDTFFNNYNPNKLREFIENKLLSLKDKFRIEPK